MPCGVTVEITPQDVNVSTGIPVVKEYVDYPAYDGPYEATPTRETQVFLTQNKRMTSDFTVNPIPSNYGLVTYNGAIITIS